MQSDVSASSRLSTGDVAQIEAVRKSPDEDRHGGASKLLPGGPFAGGPLIAPSGKIVLWPPGSTIASTAADSVAWVGVRDQAAVDLHLRTTNGIYNRLGCFTMIRGLEVTDFYQLALVFWKSSSTT